MMYEQADANASGRIGKLAVSLRFGAAVACFVAAAVGLMACGGVSSTPNGVVYTGSTDGTKLSQGLVNDPAQFPLLRATGTGSSESAAFSAAAVWEVVWAYDCSGSSGSIQVLARDSQGSTFTLASHEGNVHALGQSPTMVAGSYTLTVMTGATCQWAVGARPHAHS